MKPKFSIIIPLYNKEALLQRCLDSVLRQSNSDYELIIIDDGSTDNSLKVAQKILKQNESTLAVIVEQENSGVASARNKGASLACGDYLAFLDADDEWDAEYLSEMSKLILTKPDATLYSCAHRVSRESREVTRIKFPFTEGASLYVNDYFNIAKRYSLVNSSKVIMRKSSFLQAGGFPEGVTLNEDLFLWSRLVMLGCLAFLNKELVQVNQYVDNSRKSRINKIPYLVEYYADNKSDYNMLSTDFKGYIYSVYFRHVYGSVRSMRYSEALSRIKVGYKLFGFSAVIAASLFFVPFKIIDLIRK